MARENTKYRTINFTVDQDARFDQIAAQSGLNRNSLLRLLAETLTPADVEALAKRIS